MSKNLGGTYESFVSRCIGGVRMEQETCRELADLAEELKFIEKWEQALGLQEGRRGYGASEKTGDAYAALPPLRSLVRQRKEALETQEAALIVKTEKALREAETAKNEAEKAVQKAAKEVGDTKEQKKQEQAKFKKEKDERDGCGGSLFFVFIVCLVASGIVYWLGGRTVVPWLIFVPLAIVVLFHMRKAWLNSEMDKKLNWLDAAAARAEGMLKKRKKEAETAAATLKQRKEEAERVAAMLAQRWQEKELAALKKQRMAEVKSLATTHEVQSLTAKAEVGHVYRGKVTGIKDFGCFVEFLPGQEGLVHISELADRRVYRTEDIVKIGDTIWVKCLSVDENGKIRFSRKAALADKGIQG